MYRCVVCDKELSRIQTDYGLYWTCEGCQHWLISLALLRRTVENSFLNKIWQEARAEGQGQAMGCVLCSKSMNQIALENPGGPSALFLCQTCAVAWLSPEVRAVLPVQLQTPSAESGAESKSSLPAEAAQIAALHEVELIAERARREDQFDASHLPWWQKAMAVIGLPVLEGYESNTQFPWCSAVLTMVVFIVSVYLFGDFRSADDYGFIPREFDRAGGLTFFSSFLVHAGWVHLLSNLYFLFFFGRIVEQKIGWIGLLSLILLSDLGGNFLTLCFNPQSDIPHVGASGGIAGVLSFFGFTFPRRHLIFFFTTYGLMMPKLIRIPAWAALGLWVLLQLFGASFQNAGMSGISYSSHLGGLLAGLLFWGGWRMMEKKKSVLPREVGIK